MKLQKEALGKLKRDLKDLVYDTDDKIKRQISGYQILFGLFRVLILVELE